MRVSFNLPYRCQFGQHLAIVGDDERLGQWNVQQGVAMQWSEGDVWHVDLEVPARSVLSVLLYPYFGCTTFGWAQFELAVTLHFCCANTLPQHGVA